MTTITTVAMVVKQLKDLMLDQYNINAAQYDPELSFFKGAPLSRTDKNYQPTGEKKTYPLLVYNRSVLRSTQQGNRGYRNMLDKHDPSSLNVDSYRAAYCEFDFRFMYITKDMAQIEEFEINYNSHLHMSQNIDVKVDLGDPLGEWVYPVVWNYPLEDMLVTVEGSTYKSLTGSAKVQGHFLTMTGSLPLITDIYSKVYSTYTNELLSQEHITA